MRILNLFCCLACLTAAWPISFAIVLQRTTKNEPRTKFELHDGDRVVFVGNTFIEREQVYGYIETMLTRRFPGKKITFRNLGWAGDTVSVQLRPLNFGSLEEHVAKQNPTMLMLGYGMGESFAGEKGLPEFIQGYNRILDQFAKTKARIVLLSPIRHENLGPPIPDPTEHNKNLSLYTDAIRRVASQRGYPFVDLYQLGGKNDRPIRLSSPRLTDNGVHLNTYGYWRVAEAIERELLSSGTREIPHNSWELILNYSRQEARAKRAMITNANFSASGIRFRLKLDELPPSQPPEDTPETFSSMTVSGLPSGGYRLKIDGKPQGGVREGGFHTAKGPDFNQIEKLRQTIIRKNQLFFYRWRAHNGEYIYGRRSQGSGHGYGQGNSGNDQFPSEMKELEELIKKAEAEIHKLAMPATHDYELVLQK